MKISNFMIQVAKYRSAFRLKMIADGYEDPQKKSYYIFAQLFDPISKTINLDKYNKMIKKYENIPIDASKKFISMAEWDLLENTYVAKKILEECSLEDFWQYCAIYDLKELRQSVIPCASADAQCSFDCPLYGKGEC